MSLGQPAEDPAAADGGVRCFTVSREKFGLSALPNELVWVSVGSERLIIEKNVVQRLIPSSTGAMDEVLYVCDDSSTFKLALNLVRCNYIEPTHKRSRGAIGKLLYAARRFGLDELSVELGDRLSVLQNTVMPEIAAMLETNPRRKLLLLKSVIRRARGVDLVGGGTQSVQCKIARVKVAAALVDSCESGDDHTMTDGWKRRYLRDAEKYLNEGRNNDSLPKALTDQIQDLQKRIVDFRSSKLPQVEGSVTLPPKFSRTISEARRAFLERRALVKTVHVVVMPDMSPELLNLPDDIILINCQGQTTFSLHREEIQRFGAFANILNQRGVYVLDEPARFELALHMVRTEGHLEDAEKADDTILKSYREVARSYGLDWAVVRRLDAWLLAHRNGTGGARNAREEVRALKLTRLMSPEKGEALVASALAEAYLERVNGEVLSPTKKQRLLDKAETNLRIVLPVLLTSLSVVQVSKEQRLAVQQSVDVLKQILVMQGRQSEAAVLNDVVARFAKGIQGAANQLSSVTRDVPSGMYA